MNVTVSNATNLTNFQGNVPKVKYKGGTHHKKYHSYTKYYLNGKFYGSEPEFKAAQKRLKTVQKYSIIGGMGMVLLGMIPCCTAFAILGSATALAGTVFADKIADFLMKKGILK